MSVLFPDNPGTSIGHVDLDGNVSVALPVDQSPDWFDDVFPNMTFVDSETHTMIRGFCRDVLVYRIPQLGIRYWDVAILVPNVIFLLFLLLKCASVVNKLRAGNSPVLRAFFLLVYVCTVVNIARCICSMAIEMTGAVEQNVDRALWLTIKFFYLTTEFCVLTFGLLLGHLDNGRSIVFALVATLLISIPHTIIQVVIELKLIDKSWIDTPYFDIHSEGGLVFWVLSSAVTAMIYLFIVMVPFSCCRSTRLPSKPSFFLYCMLMVLLNITQSIGAFLIFFKSPDGLCFVDLSTFAYFVLYAPVVYFAFLRKKMKTPPNNSSGMFMYRKHKDESGSGELPEAYYPRFSGLTSPSYDDLFGYDERDARFTHYDVADFGHVADRNHYITPLITSSVETAESTVTTRTGSDDLGHRDSVLFEGTTTRHLKGLGPQGSLVFEDDVVYR